jgi:hypothetical protein
MEARKWKDLILPPFDPREGHNNALWKRAMKCREAGRPHGEAQSFVEMWRLENAHLFQRPVHAKEAREQVDHAYRPGCTPGTWRHTPDAPNPNRIPPPKKTQQSLEVTTAVDGWFEGYTLQDLINESPYPGAVFRLENIYTERDWICSGVEMKRMQTVQRIPRDPREHPGYYKEHTGISLPQFIVPNPMITEWGVTQDGRPSMRCRANACTPETRRWHVVEFDYETDGVTRVPHDRQARRLRFLSSGGAPLVLVVSSGSKSLQGWFLTAGLSKEALTRWWVIALSLGADPAGERPEQAFRFPWGKRATGEEQPVLYWAPRAPRRAESPMEGMQKRLNGFTGGMFQ